MVREPQTKKHKCDICPQAKYEYERMLSRHYTSQQHLDSVAQRQADKKASRKAEKKARSKADKARKKQARARASPSSSPAASDRQPPLPLSEAGGPAVEGWSEGLSEAAHPSGGQHETESRWVELVSPASQYQLVSTPASATLPGHVQQPYLRPTTAALLSLAMELSGQHRDRLLQIMHSPDLLLAEVPKGKKELHAFLDAKQEWVHKQITVHLVPGGDAFHGDVHVRADMQHVLSDLVNSPEASGTAEEARPILNGEQRQYSDFASGKWFERTEREVRRLHGAHAHVLGMLFYSDATEAERHGHKFRPLLLYLANFTLDGLRSARGYRRLALLPNSQQKDYPQLTNKQYMVLQRKINTEALRQALQTLKDQSYSGVHIMCQSDGIERLFFPVPAAYIADIKEANEVFNVAPYPAMFSDIRTLVQTSDMNVPGYSAQPRKQSEMHQIMQEARQLQEQGFLQQATAKLKEHCLTISDPSGLTGFAFVVSVYDLSHTDRLHQSDRGVSEHVRKMLVDSLSKEQLSMLNEYLCSLPSYPGFKIPSLALETKKSTATEMANLFKLLPVAMLAHEAQFGFLRAFTALLEFQTLRDIEVHTDGSLQELQQACLRAQRSSLKELVQYSGPTDFAFPKFWLMESWPRIISEFGSANVTSTGYGERSHILMKHAIEFTNRHGKQAIDKQAIKHAARVATIAALTPPPPPVGGAVSAAQAAVTAGRPTLASHKETLHYVTDAAASKLLAILGGKLITLKLFRRALGNFLAAGQTVQWLADLPQTNNGKIKVARNMGITHQLHRGSSLEGSMLYAGCFNRKFDRNDNVMVRDDSGRVSFAQLLLLFSYSNKHGMEKDMAFVQWYVPDKSRCKRANNIVLTRLKWHMHKIPGMGICHMTDVVPLRSILCPAFIQPDPVQDSPQRFYFNHLIGNTFTAGQQ